MFRRGGIVIGTVRLFSHIRLLLESGAVLVGSHDIRDYRSISDFGFDKNYGASSTGEGEHVGLLVTKDAEDVSIEGHGEIDGQGDSFMQMTTPHMGQDYETGQVRDPQGSLPQWSGWIMVRLSRRNGRAR